MRKLRGIGIVRVCFLLLFLNLPLDFSGAAQTAAGDDEAFSPAEGLVLDRIPQQLIGMGDGDKAYAVLVEKRNQKIYLYSHKNYEYRLLRKLDCSTGENFGDKETEGDLKTPEGVYFITRSIDGRKLPPKYGAKAFVLDYPNYLDKRMNKGGNGIWLHGTNKDLAPTDTKGCITLSNKDLLYLSEYLELNRTPIVIVERVKYRQRDSLAQENREVRDFVSTWLTYWESKELNGYMACYSKRFRSNNMDWHSWKAKKSFINKTRARINVVLEDIRIFRQRDTVIIVFVQSYRSDLFVALGLKRLYIEKEGSDWKIIGEQCRPLPPSLRKRAALLFQDDAYCGSFCDQATG